MIELNILLRQVETDLTDAFNGVAPPPDGKAPAAKKQAAKKKRAS
jgi:hypothetical protein